MTAGAGGAEFSGGIRADTLTGGAGADTLHGDNGADTISGGGGIDNILGEAGADVINGGDGADVIAGGAGADTITGGAGADEFDYADGTTTVVTVAGADTITDFATASDTIDVDGYDSTAAGTIIVEDGAALADFAAFVTRADATLDAVATDEIFVAFNAFGTGDAYVIADTDGDGSFTVGDALIILTGINTATEIVAADFI
jgi:Ca2+-binding RTX toxin-like protein